MGKKKSKKDKKDKKKKKKEKKDKKKDKKKKDKKKKSSSSSSSSSSSDSASDDAKRQKTENGKVTSPQKVFEPPPVKLDDLPPVEDGILRFTFSVGEKGPLGVRFSGGFPPMILSVNADSFAQKKKIPLNHEVHAINGLPLLPQNQESVMLSLKQRPVVLDVRPLGWKPKEKVKELERIRQREEAERNARIEVENQRREKVAKEAAEEAERQAAERAVREEQERKQRGELLARAKEERAKQREKEEEFTRAMAAEPLLFRRAADDLMEAAYGADIKVEGHRGVPLRLFTRRKEVAWLWNGEAQELIGGGAQDANDSWSH